MKKLLSLVIALATALTLLAGCTAKETQTSSGVAAAEAYIAGVLGELPENVTLAVGTAEEYGVDMTDFADGGYFIKTVGNSTAIIGKTDAGLDAAAKYFADVYASQGFVADVISADGLTPAERNAKYLDAVEAVEHSPLVLRQGSGAILSDELIYAINNAEYTEPRNYIIMIGDGMGFNTVKMSQLFYESELYGGKFAMQYLPVQSMQMTYAADTDVTDSSAGGTAIATGQKTKYGYVGVDAYCDPAKSSLEAAAERGLATGIIANKWITDATPASFTAHVENRGEGAEIAAQQLQKIIDGDLDLVLGGGASDYRYGANRQYVSKAEKEAGLTYTTKWEDTLKAEKLPVVGLYAPAEMYTQNESQPTVAEMTDYALGMLSAEEGGFYLMVEGSQIDTYSHSNDAEGAARETYMFDEAVAVAMRFVALHPDTVLIITADHETGAIRIPAGTTAENVRDAISYNSGGHSGVAVPVFAAGYGTDALLGCHENAEVGQLVFELMGETAGFKSEYYKVLDFSDGAAVAKAAELNANVTATDGGISVKFTSDAPTFTVPLDAFATPRSDIPNSSAVIFRMRNNTDTEQPVPELFANSRRYVDYRISQRDTLLPGEECEIVYYLANEARETGDFATLGKMRLCFEKETGRFRVPDVVSSELEILDVTVVSREAD